MHETATFAAGEFRSVEAAFRRVPGVVETEVGYMGGEEASPTHDAVVSGRTGHAFAVRVEYDPDQIAYEDLLGVFWRLHDPTRRGEDAPAGKASRSVIFFHSPQQEDVARRSLKTEEGSGFHRGAIATEVRAAGRWWPAEDAHQQFYER